jgi:hypothetical protein
MHGELERGEIRYRGSRRAGCRRDHTFAWKGRVAKKYKRKERVWWAHAGGSAWMCKLGKHCREELPRCLRMQSRTR